MKSLNLTLLMILGLATLNYGEPVNDIFSVTDQVIMEENHISSINITVPGPSCDTLTFTNCKRPADQPCFFENPDGGTTASKSIHRMKMKNCGDTGNVDPVMTEEKVLNEKLEQRSMELYRQKAENKKFPEPFDNDYYNFEMKIPRIMSGIINATDKAQTIQ